MFRLLIFSIFASSVAYSQDLDIRGFYTVGVAWVESDNDPDVYKYLREYDRSANVSELTRLGLNLSAPLTDSWNFNGQLLAKQSDDDDELSADWMFVTYQPSDMISLRLGKIKSDQWYISEYIDVGKTYLWVTPPEEVYSIFPVKSYNGASLALEKEFGDWKIASEVSIGNFEDSRTSGFTTISQAADHLFGARVSVSYQNTDFRVAYLDLDYKNKVNGAVVAKESPKVTSAAIAGKWGSFSIIAEGVALTVPGDQDAAVIAAATSSFYTAAGELEAIATNLGTAIANEQIAMAGGDSSAISAAVASRVAAEHLLSEAQKKLGIAAVEKEYAEAEVDGINAFHITVGNQFAEKYTPYLTYARTSATNKSPFFSSQQSMALGFVYDINFNMDIKFEVKSIEVLDDTKGYFSKVDFTSQDALSDSTATRYAITIDSVF